MFRIAEVHLISGQCRRPKDSTIDGREKIRIIGFKINLEGGSECLKN
jgi:hypothetical protein